jgi:RNA polymerase sigma-70 factor, ECF subfamily
MTDMAARVAIVVPMRVDSPSTDAVDAIDTLPSASDAALAARIRASDVDAFNAMFDRFYGRVHAYVVALTQDTDVADECVQDVMCQVWTLRARWDPRGSIHAYLLGAARNRAFNHLRHGRVVKRWQVAATTDTNISGMGQGPAATDDACRRNELALAMDTALRRLPERRRVVVTLRWTYHMTNAQIAEAIGTSVRNVEKHFTQALKTLRAELSAFV